MKKRLHEIIDSAKLTISKGKFTEVVSLTDEGLELVSFNETDNAKEHTILLTLNAWALYRIGNYAKASILLDKALSIAVEHNYQYELSKIFNTRAMHFHYQAEYPESIKYFEMALSVAQDIDDHQMIAQYNCNLALAFSMIGEYYSSISYAEKSITLCTIPELGDCLAKSYSIIGNNFLFLEDYNQSMEYYRKASDLFTIQENVSGLSQVIGNIANIYIKLQDYENASKYIKQCLDLHVKTGNNIGKTKTYLNIAILNQYQGDFEQSHNYAQIALSKAEEYGHKDVEASCRFQLFKLLSDLQNPGRNVELALEYSVMPLEYVQHHPNCAFSEELYALLASMYESLGQLKESVHYYKMFIDSGNHKNKKRVF